MANQRSPIAPSDEELVRLHAAGASIRSLAATYGMCQKTVSKIIRAHGATTSQREYTEELKRCTVQLFASGVSIGDIAQQLGFTRSTVGRQLRELGVEPNSRRQHPAMQRSIERVASGESCKAVADSIGVDDNTVRRWCVANGVSVKRYRKKLTT